MTLITTLNPPNFIQTDSYQAPTPTTSIPLIHNYMLLALGDGELCSNSYIFGILTYICQALSRKRPCYEHSIYHDSNRINSIWNYSWSWWRWSSSASRGTLHRDIDMVSSQVFSSGYIEINTCCGFSHPVPFKCKVTPRSDRVATVVGYANELWY